MTPEPTITTGGHGPWRFVAGSATGTSHVASGLPNQDRCVIVPLDDGSLIIGVADGAGSAAQAGLGAELALQAAVTALRAQSSDAPQEHAAEQRPGAAELDAPAQGNPKVPVITDQGADYSAVMQDMGAASVTVKPEPSFARVISAALHRALPALSEPAVQNADEPAKPVAPPHPLAAAFKARLDDLLACQGGEARDYHATLMAARLHPDGAGVLLSCGDALAITGDASGAYACPVDPQSGEYVGQTTFPATADASAIHVTAINAPFLLLSSDGLSPLLLSGAAPHGPAVTPLRSWLGAQPIAPVATGVHALLHSAQATGRADDDLTLVLASWQP